MLDVYVYKGRDNRVSVRLRSRTVDGQPMPDPPLQGATRITLKLDTGQSFDSTVDSELEAVDPYTVRFRLGMVMAEFEEGEPVNGYLTVYYTDKPNGVAWPGSADSPNLPTFRFLPVHWAYVAPES